MTIHPRVMARHPEIAADDAEAAFVASIRSRPRRTDPVQWVGVGMDSRGRLLEYVAIEISPDAWLVFYSMPATNKVMIEVGLRRRRA